MKKKIISDIFHIVLSPRDELDMKIFIEWCNNQKCVEDFVVAKEWGQGANPHLDATIILKKPIRQDNFRSKVSKIYSHLTKDEIKNIKVIKNTIDSSIEYYIGYTLKEGDPLPQEYYSSIEDRSYLLSCREYYYENVQRIEKIKVDLKKGNKLQLTIDRLFDSYVEYLKPKYTDTSSVTMWQFEDKDGRELDFNKHFKEWYINLDYKIPHSLYQKINQRKFVFHAQCECERLRNLKVRTDSS